MEESFKNPYDVFISYADADRAWVDGFLIEGLDRAGVRCHREQAFSLGKPRLAEFETAIRSSTRILLVLSPAYVGSETASFVDLLSQTYGIESQTWPVIPLRLEPVALPTRLSMLTSLDATDPDERELVLKKLCALFQRPLPASERPACPYPGMRAFTLDARFPFFGRDRESEELLQHLRQSRFLTVIGCSGSGKSSLVFAGLVPKLQRSSLFGPGTWRVLSMRPGERPLAELTKVLGAELADPAAVVSDALAIDPEAKRLLLILDQFEEVFTSTEGAAEPFFRVIQRLLELEAVSVVMTVRADFYAELMGTPLWNRIRVNRLDVGPLEEAGLREAIYRPADSVGVYVESGLVERLASDAAEARSPGILPLVQEALVQLWEKLERRVLPLHAYESLVLPRRAYDRTLGSWHATGLEAAIARHADGVLTRLGAEDPGNVAVARRVFLRLVHFGEGRPDTRRQQAVARLRAGNEPAAFEATLGILVKNRLITLTGDQESGRRQADIAHESLIRGWPQLQDWIAESRKAEELRRKLERKALEWVDAGASSEGLLGAAGLAEAEAFVADPEGRDLAEDDPIRRLIGDSREAIREAEAERDATRRRELENAEQRVKILLRSAVALAALLVGLVGVALYALHKRGQAQTFAAESRRNMELATESRKKAERSADEARRNAAKARQMTVDLLIERGEDQVSKGSKSAALAHFARALTLQDDSPQVQAFNRQRLGFLGQEIPRLAHILEHDGPVHSATFSPDGSRIVSAGSDNMARVWDAHSGKAIAEYKGHTTVVTSAGFSPDGTRVVSASKDGTACVWDASSGNVVSELKGHKSALSSASFSPDGNRILTASDDHTARVWDVRTGKALIAIEGHTSEILSAEFSPDGTRIVTASNDHTARVWDANSGKIVADLNGHTDAVRAARFSPDGSRVVTASLDRTAKVWDPGSGKMIADLEGHEDFVTSAVFSPDGARVLTASQDVTARLWDATSGKSLAVLKGHAGIIWSATFDPDGRFVVTASADSTARIWDPSSGKSLAEVIGHRSMVLGAVFSPDGTRLLTASADGSARVWEIGPRTSITTLSGHEAAVRSAAFGPDGARVVTASADKTARIWDATSGMTIAVLRGHRSPLMGASFSPDGTRIVTASEDRTARVWDSRSGQTIAVLDGHAGMVNWAEFSPDGTRIVTASEDRTARVWDARSGRCLVVLEAHENYVVDAEFSPDGSRILTVSADGTARLWDSRTKQEVAKLGETRLPFYCMGFSPDGTRIITAGYGGRAQLWDSATFERLNEFKVDNGLILCIAFDPTGSRVVTACPDATARVRDASNGLLIGELRGHTARLCTAQFSPDGRRIVTSSEDRTARIWSIHPLTGDPRSIGLWAEVVTGTKLDGEIGMTAAEWKDRRRRLKALGDKAPPTPWLDDVGP